MQTLNERKRRLYLARLGVAAAEPPSAGFLARLQRAHVERIPWETIDVFNGRPVPIDAASCVGLILGGRSGYCFHLNTAFAALLVSLGFTVNVHRAGVQARGRPPVIDSLHMGLTVAGDGETWLVDAGLGDMPYEPIPLRWGVYPRGPLAYRLIPSVVAAGGWRLVNDTRASYVGADFSPTPVPARAEFLDAHRRLSTDPDSPWVNRLVVTNRDALGSSAMQGLVLTRLADGVPRSQVVDRRAEWFDALADIFGERLLAYGVEGRAALWDKVLRRHEEWMRESTGSGAGAGRGGPRHVY